MGEEGNRHSKKKKKEKPAFCWTKNLSAKIDKGESGIKKTKRSLKRVAAHKKIGMKEK